MPGSTTARRGRRCSSSSPRCPTRPRRCSPSGRRSTTRDTTARTALRPPRSRSRRPRFSRFPVAAGSRARPLRPPAARPRRLRVGGRRADTARDPTFPMPDGPWPGTGAVVAAVEAATGVRAHSVGKPEPQLFLAAVDRLGPGRALVVGDRIDADVAGAVAAGLDAALVLTGASSELEARAADPAPALVAAPLGEPVPGP